MADQKTPPPALVPEPSASERELMIDSFRRTQARRKRAKVKIEKADGPRSCDVGPGHNDVRGWLIRLNDAFGTSSDDFALAQLNKLIAIAQPSADAAPDNTGLNALLAAVDGVRPENEIEAMLATQMAVTHALAMMCLIRAHKAEHLAQMEANSTLATKMLRTYTAQVEALAKLRRGGEQTVRVEHVHVHSGGQAIVGKVDHGRGEQKNGEQARAAKPGAIEFASGAEVWREDAIREAVPVACGQGQEAVPHARRRAR